MKRVALSFDFEECDLPRERGVDFSLEEGMRLSIEGANALLDILERQGVRATFFCTLNFAQNAKDVMKRLIDGGNEIGAHGVDHFHQTAEDPILCKEGIEKLYNVKIDGYRQPRMFPVDDKVLLEHGYRYNSSINPAFIPGRYMHLNVPRKIFERNNLKQVPASVTPIIRFPLFWLSLHLLPEWMYQAMVKRTLRHDGYFVTYFHPWEFSSINKRAQELKVPMLVRSNLGDPMLGRLERLIEALRKEGSEFVTIRELI